MFQFHSLQKGEQRYDAGRYNVTTDSDVQLLHKHRLRIVLLTCSGIYIKYRFLVHCFNKKRTY
jgi:hypothetical protein